MLKSSREIGRLGSGGNDCTRLVKNGNIVRRYWPVEMLKAAQYPHLLNNGRRCDFRGVALAGLDAGGNDCIHIF
jgi:hypothetical protein